MILLPFMLNVPQNRPEMGNVDLMDFLWESLLTCVGEISFATPRVAVV